MAADRAFDLDAAELRADGADLGTRIDVLAAKLEGALPDQTVVRRRSHGLLSRRRVVEEVEAALGDRRYGLRVDRGRVECARRQAVRGIVIRSEELDLDAWLAALTADLREQAATSEQARAALERLVG